MKTLRISDDLTLPLDAVTQKFAWLGVTGSGKTYGASKLAELMLDAGAQIVILDVVGVWYGLRLAKDGRRPSELTIPIFGGLHADVPLEPTAGALIANLIVDRGISVIIDISQFETDAQKARFGVDFADRFFFRKKASPSAVHLFIEEAQELVPQNPMKGEERMLHAFTRLQKLGRNFGIGSSYISQRPQEVNKKALNMAQTLFVFRTTGTHERSSIEKWIKDKALDQDIAGDLPKIRTGDCHVWSPEFLEVSEIVRIAEKRTFNASSTPEVGVTAAARHLAPIDLEKIREDMAATIERAKETDPEEWKKKFSTERRRVAELERQIATEKPSTKEPKFDSAKLREMAKKEGDRALAKALRPIFAAIRTVESKLEVLRAAHVKESDAAVAAVDALAAVKVQAEEIEKAGVVIEEAPAPRPAVMHLTHPMEPRRPVTAALERIPADGISDPQQRILDTLALLEQLGVEPSRDTLAAWYGSHPNSKGFSNNLSALRSSKLLDGVSLTDTGRAAARSIPIPSQEELRDRILSPLTDQQKRIVGELLSDGNGGLTRDGLAERLGVHPNSKGYSNNLSALRTRQLITRGSPIKPGRVLFLES